MKIGETDHQMTTPELENSGIYSTGYTGDA